MRRAPPKLLTRPRRGFFLEPATRWPAPGFSPMPLLDDQKRALRAEVRARIPKTGSPEFISASLRAQQRLLDAALLEDAGVVALYRALPTECGTAFVAAGLQAQ